MTRPDTDSADERLRALYARAHAARGGDRAACVTPEAMLAVVRHEGSEAERVATLDHVMTCDACSRELETLRAIVRAGGDAAAGDAPAVPSSAWRDRAWWRRAAPLALAAAVLLAVGVGVLGRAGRRDAGVDVTRGASDAVVLVAPAEEIPAGATPTFVWHAAAGASRYELEVLDATDRAVLVTSTPDTTAALPDTVRLAAGATYHWWVRVASDAGAQRASPARPLRVRSR